MAEGQAIPGTFVCLFCQGVMTMRNGDSQKFRMHMEVYHEVFSHWEIILACHFLKEEEKEHIVSSVKYRMEKVQETGIQVKQEILGFLDPDFDIGYKDTGHHVEETKLKEDNPNFEDSVDGDYEVGRKQVEEIDYRINEETSCNEEISSLNDETKTGANENTSCQFCKRKFTDITFLERHTRNKVCLKYYACNLCGMKFNNVSKLKRHMKENKKSCGGGEFELDFEINIENASLKKNTTERRVMDGTENVALNIMTVDCVEKSFFKTEKTLEREKKRILH